MDELKKKSPIICAITTTICIISTVLQSVDMFESNGLLPKETFKKALFVLSTVFAITAIIICLINFFYPLYIDVQIKAMKRAKKSIYILMDSLNPEKGNYKLIKFDRLLEYAIDNKLDVKVLTRTGTEPERSRGAYDICVVHGLDEHMKFSSFLNAKTLRCTLIDDEEIIISCSKGTNKGFSKKYKHFYNEKLNKILKKYIDEKFDYALTYKEFIYNRLEEMEATSDITSIKRASEILNIPEHSLRKLLKDKGIEPQ